MTHSIVFVALFVFGFVYNWLVGWLEKKGYHEGYVALLVVGGVGATLVGFRFIAGLETALWCLACFATSGFWMVVGSWWRHVRECEKMRREAHELFTQSGRVYLESGDSKGASS